MYIRASLLLLAMIAISACSSRNLSPDDESYLKTARDHPTQFVMLKGEEGDAWARAVLWIRSYSSMSLVTVNDTLIATDPPGKGRDWELSYGYTVQKKDKGDRVVISVLCGANNIVNGGDARENAHLLAYYIATGDPNPPLLIHK